MPRDANHELRQIQTLNLQVEDNSPFEWEEMNNGFIYPSRWHSHESFSVIKIFLCFPRNSFNFISMLSVLFTGAISFRNFSVAACWLIERRVATKPPRPPVNNSLTIFQFSLMETRFNGCEWARWNVAACFCAMGNPTFSHRPHVTELFNLAWRKLRGISVLGFCLERGSELEMIKIES